ncbi:hypothetical protein DFS34DRAFT_149094 [Phlyctochytrium arcticum]|nr:hypothetical protein DFS34DRAFT_149094 [Phlyctochytrium arcticum]
MTSSAIPPPSAEDLVLKLRSAPLTERGKIIFSIIAAHQEHPDFAHLVDSLLKTEVVATSIALPTSHDPSAANNLDSDAIATIPEIIHAPLLSPQSNLAARYFEYELGINLAVQAKMNSTLVKELLRPSPIKKREVVAACVDHASDTLIADVYPNCVPAIQNMLVTALIKAGRATLAQSIVGPHKFVTGRESHPCAKLQMDLEKTTDPWQRSPIWETARSAINDISPWMTDSQYEQVLTLQEKFPPLHPLALPGADRMYPALSSIIVALMPILLRRYPKRLKKVVEDTAVVPQGTHAENPTWGLSPHLSKLLSRPKIWTREPDQAIELESILMRLLTFKNGQLLTTGKYPAFDAAFLGRARAPVIVSMLRIMTDHGS